MPPVKTLQKLKWSGGFRRKLKKLTEKRLNDIAIASALLSKDIRQPQPHQPAFSSAQSHQEPLIQPQPHHQEPIACSSAQSQERKEANSQPHKDWRQICCIIKRENLATFDLAELELVHMDNDYDTEEENRSLLKSVDRDVQSKNVSLQYFNYNPPTPSPVIAEKAVSICRAPATVGESQSQFADYAADDFEKGKYFFFSDMQFSFHIY